MTSNSRKPALDLVPSSTNRKSPPTNLEFGPAGRKLWAEITAQFHFEEAAEIELLKQACGAADRIDAATKQIQAEGLTVKGKSGIRAHPLLKTEHLQRSFLCRTLGKLGLLEKPKKVGRPPHGGVGMKSF